MDVRMESLLEDMQVNWSIIKTALENDEKCIEEAKKEEKKLVEGTFKLSSHIEGDKVIKHHQKKDVIVEGGISTELIKKSVDTRKRLGALESF